MFFSALFSVSIGTVSWSIICDWGILLSYGKTCVKRPHSKRRKIGFQDQLSLSAGQEYCSMLQGEHPAILSTFIKLPFVIKMFVLSIFEWPFYTGCTVFTCLILIKYLQVTPYTFEYGRGKTSEIQVSLIMQATFGPPAKCYLNGVGRQ